MSLIIIDYLANLYEFSDVDNFSDNHAMIKEFKDFIVNNNLCCILIHYTKKGKSKFNFTLTQRENTYKKDDYIINWIFKDRFSFFCSHI